jgi:serine/threonine-protein kinase
MQDQVEPGSSEPSERSIPQGHAFTMQRLGRYHILRPIGIGGLGEVYEAYDPSLARKVAIKVLHATANELDTHTGMDRNRARLVREAKVLARLSHPNIVPIYDVGYVDDTGIFLTLELIEGRTYRQVLDDPTVSRKAQLGWLLDAARGLAAAHEAGILHRDFKPENVMIGKDGQVYVLDFGIALEHAVLATPHEKADAPSSRRRATLDDQDRITAHDRFVGTPAYMAPEQMVGQDCTPAADLFAFGAVLYETFCKERPFDSRVPAQRLAQIESQQLAWPKSVPKWLRHIVARLLAAQPAQRGGSLAQVIEEIENRLTLQKSRRTAIRWSATLVIFLMVVIPLLASVFTRMDETTRCQSHNGSAVEEKWSAQFREEIARAFERSSVLDARDRWHRCVELLDRWRQDWRDATISLCVGEVPGSTGALDWAQREQARTCLAEGQAEVSALLELWREPSLAQVLESVNTASTLMSPKSCLDAQTLRARAPLPIDPRLRKEVRLLRAELGATRLRIRQASFEAAKASLDAIHERVLATADTPIIAEYFSAIGEEKYRATERDVSAQPHLLRSILWSQAANRPFGTATHLGEFWFTRVYRDYDIAASYELLRAHEAQVHRADDVPELLMELERNRGIHAALSEGNLAQTLVFLERSLEFAQDGFGANSVEAARILDSLGYTSYLRAEFDDALRYFSEALNMQKSLLGDAHPESMRSHARIQETLNDSGQPAEALRQSLESVAICKRSGYRPEQCPEFYRRISEQSLAIGELGLAADYSLYALSIERSLGRRLDPVRANMETLLGEVLLQRGEIEAGNALIASGMQALRAERGFHLEAAVSGIMSQVRGARFAGNIIQTEEYLHELGELMYQPSESIAHYAPHFYHELALLNWAKGEHQLAREAFRSALFYAHSSRLAPHLLAPIELNLASYLFENQEYEAAAEFAEHAWLLETQQVGLAAHRRLEHDVLRAGLALIHNDPSTAADAWMQGCSHFERDEIPDSRAWGLLFFEAKLALAWDDSENGRRNARWLGRELFNVVLKSGTNPILLRQVQTWLDSPALR